jgi:hypothetical protein
MPRRNINAGPQPHHPQLPQRNNLFGYDDTRLARGSAWDVDPITVARDQRAAAANTGPLVGDRRGPDQHRYAIAPSMLHANFFWVFFGVVQHSQST